MITNADCLRGCELVIVEHLIKVRELVGYRVTWS